MYLGNSDELRQRIKEYNKGPSGNFIFNRRDLKPIGKIFRGITSHTRDFEYVRDFAIVDTKPLEVDDNNWTSLKEEIKKIIQRRSQPGDNLWNSTPQFIYFYWGLRTLDNDAWILVKRKDLYLAAKEGSGLTQPSLRFTQQTPIKVLGLWDLQGELGMIASDWKKIEESEEELIKKEQKEQKEDREKLHALRVQTVEEVHEILKGYQREDLELSSDYLELFFTDRCSCETPGKDWVHHLIHCVGKDFSEVEEFAKRLKEEMQKAVDKFIQWREGIIQKVEAELVAKDLSEVEVFDSQFYSDSPNWEWDWRAKIRSVKDKFILGYRERDLISYIELKSKLKNIRNNSGGQNEGQENQNWDWEEWWEKQKQEWDQARQTRQQEADEERKKREKKKEERDKKEKQEEENLKSEQAEFDWQREPLNQSEKGKSDSNKFRPSTTEIPSFLSPEELEEVSTDKDSPSPKESNLLPPQTPAKPKKEEEESEENLNKLRAEIETLKRLPNKTPLQEKELKQKESRLRWLEDRIKKGDKIDRSSSFKKESAVQPAFFLIGGLLIVGVLVLLFVVYSTKKREK